MQGETKARVFLHRNRHVIIISPTQWPTCSSGGRLNSAATTTGIPFPRNARVQFSRASAITRCCCRRDSCIIHIRIIIMALRRRVWLCRGFTYRAFNENWCKRKVAINCFSWACVMSWLSSCDGRGIFMPSCVDRGDFIALFVLAIFFFAVWRLRKGEKRTRGLVSGWSNVLYLFVYFVCNFWVKIG